MAKFKVVAFEEKRFELVVEADTEEKAKHIADFTDISSWNQDYEYYSFDIEDAHKIKEEK